MSHLPFAVEAEVPLTPSDLQALREQYEKEVVSGSLTSQTQFNYAWGLVRSSSKNDQSQGVRLLHEVYLNNPNRRRECVYYLALGNYKMGNYREARKFNDSLLAKEPTNAQAISLRDMINDKVQKEGLVGMAIVGGVVAAAGVLVAGLLRRH